MRINKKEVKTCIEYVLFKLTKPGSLHILEAELSLDKKVVIKSKVIYKDQPLDISVSFLIDYKDNQLCIKDIEGVAEYLVFKINVMNIIKQFLNHNDILVEENCIYYKKALPIEAININEDEIEVILK